MIKPEELRIGDFVRVSNDNCIIPKGAICEVVDIDSERSCEDKKGIVGLLQTDREKWDFSHGVWCEGIEGIPITPEILEKNGWEQEYYAPIIYGHIGHDIEISFLQTSKRCSVLLNDISLCEILYVHELQHILWALGEDVNLKI